MEEVKKLELKIKNNSRYEDIIEQSMQIDKYIDKIIEGALQLPHIYAGHFFLTLLNFDI